MTLVDADTGEVVQQCTPEAARDLTDKIKLTVEGAWQLIKQAYETRAWASLGYSSWDDYCTREFGHVRLRLPREDRQETIVSLRDAGLSIRAISVATGNSKTTIQKDLGQVSRIGTPGEHATQQGGGDDGTASEGDAGRTPDGEGRKAPTSDTADPGDGSHGHDVGRPVPEPPPTRPDAQPDPEPRITGTDGKTYKSTAQKQTPRRASLPEAAEKAGWELRRATERLERIRGDDRFASNKEQVAAHWHGHLSYAIEVCQDLIARLDHQPSEDL